MPVISKFTVGGHPVTKYNNQRLRQFVINGETCPFAKVAESLNGTLPDPISYRIHRLQASGNSSQATGSVPKYICQGASSVLNIGSFIKGDIYNTPISSDGITATFSQSNGTYAITGASTAQGNVLLHNSITLENGHKYLVPTFRDATAAGASNYFQWGNVYARGIPAANFYWPDQSKAQSWAIVTGNGSSGYCIFNFMSGLDTSVTGFDPSGCFNLIDLTQLYGAGNEPANPETVFQDYPEIPVGNDSWIKNDVIRSITAVHIGTSVINQTLRSAGSAYDDASSNGHGSRNISLVLDLGTLVWSWENFGGSMGYLFSAYLPGAYKFTDNDQVANMLCTKYTARSYLQIYNNDIIGISYGFNNGSKVFIRDTNYANNSSGAAALQADLSGVLLVYELATPAQISFTPLTPEAGLTPVDQNGDSVTFTETTEATPSPNYPVPITNSTLISITDGEDTDSAVVDLSGLTNKDEVYVNVKSTNIWDEDWSVGTIDNTTGQDASASNRIRSNSYIPVTAGEDYTLSADSFNVSGNGYLLYMYDADKAFVQYQVQYGALTVPSGIAFIRFAMATGYGTTYKNDIIFSLGSSPVPYMPHDTIGKVWKKQQVYRYEITGNEAWSTNNERIQWYFGGTLPKSVVDDIGADCKCNRFRQGTQTGQYGHIENNTVAVWTSSGEHSYMSFRCTEIGVNDTAFKAWAAGLYANGTPVVVYYPLRKPIWTDITSSAMGAALLALETMEETSNTITINNSGVIDMVQYFTPI